MRFSVICPSYLGQYKNAAKNRDMKIIRAIQSVEAQTFDDWELLVISDGCLKTIEIVEPLVSDKIRLLGIDKQPLWSCMVRNTGIAKAQGEIITYLDIDDKLGVNHLQIINDNFKDYDWVYYNDWRGENMTENNNYLQLGKCGTSTISHKRKLEVGWTRSNYAHDWIMVKMLMLASKNYAKIPTPEYIVCHVPGIRSYDI